MPLFLDELSYAYVPMHESLVAPHRPFAIHGRRRAPLPSRGALSVPFPGHKRQRSGALA